MYQDAAISLQKRLDPYHRSHPWRHHRRSCPYNPLCTDTAGGGPDFLCRRRQAAMHLRDVGRRRCNSSLIARERSCQNHPHRKSGAGCRGCCGGRGAFAWSTLLSSSLKSEKRPGSAGCSKNLRCMRRQDRYGRGYEDASVHPMTAQDVKPEHRCNSLWLYGASLSAAGYQRRSPGSKRCSSRL